MCAKFQMPFVPEGDDCELDKGACQARCWMEMPADNNSKELRGRDMSSIGEIVEV